ncbi:MAG: hypothetical protein U1E23_14560 [Reyranellaceae bacterium]
MATAYLIVRARLNELADRKKFDDWYRTEHLPEAVRKFEARRAWRAWSRTNPMVHIALYEFTTVEEPEALIDSQVLDELIGGFDRAWGDKVTRTREIVEVEQEYVPPPLTPPSP